MIFLPHMMQKRFGYADLDVGARWWLAKKNITDASCFGNPDVAHEMEEAFHRELDLEWSYGGWMEDRSTIRCGTYIMEKGIPLHTGIDVNANAGTTVCAVSSGPIVYHGTDAPMIGGWGYHLIQKIIYRNAPHALLYAHLLSSPPSKLKGFAEKGAPIGQIGWKDTNGFWRPHLHLQLFADIDDVTDWAAFSREMDGYVKPSERTVWARKCPDPTPLIFA